MESLGQKIRAFLFVDGVCTCSTALKREAKTSCQYNFDKGQGREKYYPVRGKSQSLIEFMDAVNSKLS